MIAWLDNGWHWFEMAAVVWILASPFIGSFIGRCEYVGMGDDGQEGGAR